MFLRAAVLSLVVFPSAVLADPLTELETARAQANAHFQAADARVRSVGAVLSAASEAFRGCRNGSLQFQFTGAITRLESARRTLEKGRKEAQALRASLEATRAKLEAAHGRRNAGTREEAVANEQLYAERLLADYVRPLDTTLVPLVDEYTAGIAAYSQALVEYAEFCKRPGYTVSGGAAFVAGFEPSVERVIAGSEHLLTTAAEAKKASTARAVSAK
ncbi:MAG: hypothetical protein Q8L48_20350 [Archangium sp.]|nr:hypothetical protein [Archangium sp.]